MSNEERMQEIIAVLRCEFEATVGERAARYAAVEPHEIVPFTHFAEISAECARIHRDGHFYGSIALCQAVGEAIVRHIQWRYSLPVAEFEVTVRKLRDDKTIPTSTAEDLLELWKRRNDYHHLNPAIETEYGELESLSREKNERLKSIECEVFGYSIHGGRLALKYPKLWDVKDGGTAAWLRFGKR